MDFDTAFSALTDNSPFRWQARLYERFLAGEIPEACDIPTGLGKTSVMAIWLIALAQPLAAGRSPLPRRLVYVVNRRTIVDQATDIAEKIRAKLLSSNSPAPVSEIADRLRRLCVDPELPLAISTLRGEFADNGEWLTDPARPAIIVGTVDMIGSRLLFSGYGAGRSSRRAQNAGLIGHDSFFVHDEAHLSPAFGALVRHIATVQRKEDGDRALRFLELSATQRGQGPTDVFRLDGEDWKEDLVRRRVNARKSLRLHPLPGASLPETIADHALWHCDKKARVLVYVQKPEDAREVQKSLLKKAGNDGQNRIGILTGTLRGFERDLLLAPEADRSRDGIENPVQKIFPAFRAADTRPELDRTLFLISTSAGEVGADLDADHLVCDLTTLDSMIQRLGRVNRLGRDDPEFVACIDVVDAPDEKGAAGKLSEARKATRIALQESLAARPDGGLDASPAALRALLDRLGPDGVRSAFAPEPRILPCTDILLDGWALTSLRELPGRPPVARWLHGVESDPPETVVAWRSEVEHLTSLELDEKGWSDCVEDWLDAHRILPRERLRDRSDRIAKQIGEIAKRDDEALAILIGPSGAPQRLRLRQADSDRIAGATLLLPSGVGGFDHESGMIDGKKDQVVKDVADLTAGARRLRLLIERSEDGGWTIQAVAPPIESISERLAQVSPDESWSLGKVIDNVLKAFNADGDNSNPLIERRRIKLGEDDAGPSRILLSIGRARGADTLLSSSSAAGEAQKLQHHLGWTHSIAERVTNRLGLNDSLASAIESAAGWHDLGKRRDSWQRAIGNRNPDEPLAKSGRRGFAFDLRYRHELGSMIEAASKISGDPDLDRDLILHLIAAHHGWARPHFEEQAGDPDASDERNAAAMTEAMRRYARLQRRFGRWRLAWLESLVKASDAIASARGAEVENLPA